MAEPKLMQRGDLMEGYVLDPVGATVGDAIRTADISIPQYRQSLTKGGKVILTQFNANEGAAELATEPPTLESCQMALDVINARKEKVIVGLRDQLAEAKEELKADLSRNERSYWKGRRRQLEAKIELVATEEVTADELHVALVREDIALRAKFVPPEIREAMQAVDRERQFNALLAAQPGSPAETS